MMKRMMVLALALAISGCAGTASAPVKSRCFDGSGRAICTFKPLPELWQEAVAENA